MIIHQYSDGSRGYEYQPGDRVRVLSTVTKIFDDVEINDECVVLGYWYPRETNWLTSFLSVQCSPEWGPAMCAPWQLRPTHETLSTATVEYEEWNILTNKTESDTNYSGLNRSSSDPSAQPTPAALTAHLPRLLS